jgi:GMP synthase (glutamine-hydrolysing)
MRILILQIRNPGDPMIEAEIMAFAQTLGRDPEEITVSTLLLDPPRERDLKPYDLLLIGGSGDYSVTRDDVWMEPALDCLRGAVTSGKPLFASCFGFQAIAQALGGQVVHDKARAELGSNPIQLTEAGKSDPVFGLLPSPFLAQMGHEDCVDVLPEGAVLLASTERVQHQAYRLRDKPIYATQFHPELDREALLARLRTYPKYVEQIAGVPFDEFTDNCRETPEANSLLRRFVAEFLP